MADNREKDQGNEEEILDYEEMKQVFPEREIKLEEVAPTDKTLSEEEDEAASISDIQAILKSIRIKFKNKRLDDLLQPAMKSRIPPEVMMDKHFLIASSTIEEQCYNVDFDPVGIISQTQDGLMVGLNGMGIADLLELALGANNQELDKLQKGLGL